MKVLVIGANGQLGSDLVRILSKENAVFPVFRNPEFGEFLDVEDHPSVQRCIDKYIPDVVINTSAFHQVDLCEKEQKKAYSVNVVAVNNLSKICKEKGIVFVTVSTDYVFDGKKDEPYNEEDLPNPINAYGKSKLEGEYAARNNSKHFIIRTSYLYGLSSGSQKKSNLINTLLNAGKKGEMKAVFDNKISPTFTYDLAKKISELIKTNEYGVYHIANSGSCSVYELAEEICKIEGLFPRIDRISVDEMNALPDKAQRPRYTPLTSINLKKAGLSEMRPWKEALREYLQKSKMGFTIEKEFLNGGLVIVPKVFEDNRGFFMESYRKDKLSELGIDRDFVQDSHSGSVKNVLRGLHFQWEPPMGKLMRVTKGEAFLVAVDIRKDSPTFGKWFGETASEKNKKQVWAPPGFARGFCVLSDYAEVQYKCSSTYNPKGESGILWNDPAIGIEWPVSEPIVSEKDKVAQTLSEWAKREEAENFRMNK